MGQAGWTVKGMTQVKKSQWESQEYATGAVQVRNGVWVMAMWIRKVVWECARGAMQPRDGAQEAGISWEGCMDYPRCAVHVRADVD